MAIIGQIRRKGGFLIAIVIGVALAAFILGDLLGPGGTLSNTGQYEIGEISGEVIPAQSFEIKVQETIENYKKQSNQTSIPQQTIDQLREQTWAQLLNEIILGGQYNKLGLAVHPDEIFDLVTGSNPHQSVIQAFSNPKTGQFNTNDVVNFLKTMDNDATGATRAQWLPFEKAIKKDRLTEKYYNLIKNGLYITSKEARLNYEFQNGFAKFDYVLFRYASLADSIVTISDKELKAYYNANKKEHEQETSRTIEYVAYDVIPSQNDTIIAQDWINRIKKEISEISDLEEVESFVNMNADNRYVDRFYKRGDFSLNIDSSLFSSDTNYIEGPFLEDAAYKVVKLLEIANRPDSIKARHILISLSENGDSSHIIKADSILNLINNGADFALIAQTTSADPGSAANGGDLGWFQEGTMVKPFNDSCFSSKTGDLMIVYTQFGAHIIEVLDMTEPIKKIKVAIVDRKIEPSSKTFAGVYAKVNRFAGSNKTSDAFRSAAEENGLVTRVAENLKQGDKTIVGLEFPREIIRWTYKAEEGDVSGPFELGNKFVVATITNIIEEGYASLDEIRTEMEVGARNKKKAEIIISKLKANDDQNVEDLAHNFSANNKGFEVKIESIDKLSFESFNIPGIGREPKLIGKIYGSKVGVLSEPLQGNIGVYVFVLREMIPAPETSDFSANKGSMGNNLKARVDYEVFNALEKAADVVDNRHIFY
ncbi:MAG TPA: hypothetical protein EYM84_02580 [Flavobacteriales bacterium]|nr:hypothetical protein [Flavobacteriales bacterium]HIN39142.1 hypothetical protein [Flavobacteriales bacterium]